MKIQSNKKTIIMLLVHILLWIPILVLLAESLQYQREGPTVKSVEYVNQVEYSIDGKNFVSIELPYTIENLPNRTPVTVRAKIHPDKDDGIFIKAPYSPAKVYVDDELVFQFGKRENYPTFMKDPATEIHIIELYGTGEKMDLRIEYLSPTTKDSLVLQPFMVGTAKELIMERSRVHGIPFVLSLVEIFAGLALIIISAYLIMVDKKGQIFLWLGLSSLSIGCWMFGQNSFSSIMFRQNTFLYIISFIGLYTFLIPLIHFVRTTIDFIDEKPLRYLEIGFALCSSLALFLQLFGLVSFVESKPIFYILCPLTLVVVTGYTLREYIIYKNPNAYRLCFPIGILALTSILEFFHINPPFPYIFSSIFQLGMIIFLLIIGVMAGAFIKDSIHFQNIEKELEFEKSMLDLQTEDQEKRSQILVKNEQILSRQRHDLRHQLIIIQELANPDNVELQNYLKTLMNQIPTAPKKFCNNSVVNTVLSYYDSVCEKQNIEFTCHLEVPSIPNQTTNSILCAIFSNLLENAVEACTRLEGEKRYIKLNSRTHYDMLTITMDNSFNGQIKKQGNKFISSKRNEYGIGIASIQSLAQKLEGDTNFTTKDNVFLSNVYVKL